MEHYVVEYLDDLRQRKHRSVNTISAYEQDLLQFVRYVQKKGILRLERINETICNGYLLELEGKGLSACSIQRRLSSMRGFFDYLIRKGYIREDPTELLNAMKASPRQTVSLQEREKRKIIQAVEVGKGNELRDKLILSLVAVEGLCPAEVTALKVEDIRFTSSILLARREKHERNVMISSETLVLLNDFCANKSGYLFPSRNGEKMTRQAIWKLIRSYGKKAGIEKINPQQLRRK